MRKIRKIFGVGSSNDFWWKVTKLRKEKKYRGIAGGTIPRVPRTPSLAAGVIWKPHHLWNKIKEK
ncbi:hypothetical protein AB4077_09720 [Vibrio cyclitrophicus]|nr:hypothetical protein [Vibrio cyclitrophicus]